MFQSLEKRALYSVSISVHAGVIDIKGTQKSEGIFISEYFDAASGKSTHYQIDSYGYETSSRTIPAEGIRLLKIRTLGGDDNIATTVHEYTGAIMAGTRRVSIPIFADGGEGNDSLNGGTAADRLIGGSGKDTFDGGEGDDVLIGGSGDDNLYGGPGADRIYGQAGNDSFTSEPLNTNLTSGNPTGSAAVTPSPTIVPFAFGVIVKRPDLFSGGPGTDTLTTIGSSGAGSMKISSIESVLSYETLPNNE